MKNIKNNSSQLKIKNQTGAALLIAMVVLASMAAFYLIANSGAVSQKHQREVDRIGSLAKAKKALIAHAVNYIDNYSTGGIKHDGEMGFLPCPDRSAGGIAEGLQDGTCGAANINTIGRLPWRSLDLPPLFDESNECLWYAVTGYYKANPKTQMLNEDTNGMLTVSNAQGTVIYGNNAADRVVAVVIAPGEIVQGQTRNTVANTERCKGNYTVSNYLEGDGGINNSVIDTVNPDQTDTFIKAGTGSDEGMNPFNDLLITITRDEIWDAVKRRRNFRSSLENLTKSIADCIATYGEAGTIKNLPWPAAVDLAGADYRLDSSYADTTAPASLLGRLPENVANSEAQLDANATGGGDTGGVSVAGPPDCSACKSKFDKYLEELAEELADFRLDVDEANADYQLCLADPDKTQAECDAALADDLAAAQTKYDEEVADIAADELQDYTDCLLQHPNTCSSNGGGTAGHCNRCLNDFNDALDQAVSDRDKSLGDIPGEFVSCTNKPNADIAACEEERDKDIADANKDYAEDVAEAQALYDLCTTANSCPASGGSKGIENILNNCLATADFDLWRHWKDHFFYVVSGSYAPDSTEVSCTAAGAECVSTSGESHAAIVMFSGARQNGLTRNDPVSGDIDSKIDISNYLEGANVGDYPNPPDPLGNRSYDPNAASGDSKDYLYCINDSNPLVTGPCP
ncbi:MAG: hypothetical protein OEY29_15150 [Gammaproteobacteria bacterium]|nr:hypothetical protein [Gammaproteobacteria bacterium]